MRRFSLLLVCVLSVLLWTGCGKSSSSTSEYVTVELSPLDVNVPLGATQLFKAVTYNNSDTAVIWYVNNVKGGDSTHGTITQEGLYTAPTVTPDPSTVTITVVANANSAVYQNAAAHITSGITVAVTPNPTDLQLGATQQFTATLSGTSDSSVTWYAGGVAGGNSTAGTISSSGLYTAPSAADTPTSVTITAVSKADPTKSGSATITLHGGIKVTLAPGPASVQTRATQQFNATVTGNSNTDVTWKVNGIIGGSAKTGTITSAGLYTAPTSVPTTTSGTTTITTPVMVTAVSQADSWAIGSVTVTVFAPNSKKQTTPILLGTSGGDANDSSGNSCCGGTLGALVSRGGNQYILSTSHVLAPGGSKAGDAIIQPALLDTSCSVADTTTVANLSQFVDLKTTGTGVDAAIAQVISGDVDAQGTILQLGATMNNGQPIDAPPHAGSGATPSVGLAVAKSGRSTGLTCATISAINVTMSLQYPVSCGSGTTYQVILHNLIDIFGTDFSAQGDSGALIVTQSTSDPVALLVASTDSDSVAIPVSDVLSAMADPSTSERPVFVGTSVAHSVAGCASTSQSVSGITEAQLALARSVQSTNESRLLAMPGIHGLGITSSPTDSRKAALVIYADPGTDVTTIPGAIDGIQIRMRELPRFQLQSGAVKLTRSCSVAKR